MRTIHLLLFSILAITMASCQHDPIEVPPVTPPVVLEPRDSGKVYFVNDVLPVLRSACGVSGCHEGNSPAVFIDLTSYDAVMNSKVLDEHIVNPGKPNDSKLYRVLKGLDFIPMPPLYNFQISDKQKVMIRDWILQGALNNECLPACDSTEFTYFKTIRPLIDKYCTGCHYGNYPNNGQNLEDYTDLQRIALNDTLLFSLRGENGLQRMPKYSDMPNCEIRQIEKWIEAGALKN